MIDLSMQSIYFSQNIQQLKVESFKRKSVGVVVIGSVIGAGGDTVSSG